MRRGRSSTHAGSHTPASGAASGAADSANSSESSTRRQTRSSSARKPPTGDSIHVAHAARDSDPVQRKPNGRPFRASLPAASRPAASSVPASLPIDAPPLSMKRTRSRQSKASIADGESISSVPTPADASTDGEYSTPATSKLPTPVAADGPSCQFPQRSSTLEVRIPSKTHHSAADSERALRKSVYSLNANPNKMASEIMDPDDDDISDSSPDAKVARRLQRREYSSLVNAAASKSTASRRNSRTIAPSPALPALPSRVVPKRGRASIGSSVLEAPPTKKCRVIPDSDAVTDLDIDIDAEIAAVAALDSDELPFLSDDEISFVDESSGLSNDSASDSDSMPLARTRRPPAPATKATRLSRRRAPPAKARNESLPGFPAVPIGRGLNDGQDAAHDTEDESEFELSPAPTPSAGLGSVAPSDAEDDDEWQIRRIAAQRRGFRSGNDRRLKKERSRLETHHPELSTMWKELEAMPVLNAGIAKQPQNISRQLKPFQLEGLAWMKEMETMEWKGGLLGDEMGLGKTIQAVSLIMSDYPAKQPSLVLVPPVALMQWQSEIKSYTDGTLNTFVFHGTNQKAKGITVKELKKYDVIMMSYNSLESMYRKQERGFKRKNGIHKEKSVIHSIRFHRIILDEAHCIKTRTTMTAKACFALQTEYRWCLTGTPLQNRIGEFFSLIRFLNVKPFASYLCKQCPCSALEWVMDDDHRCKSCRHPGMQHVSVFNQELLNPIQRYGNAGPGREALRKLRLMTARIMLRRLKKDHTNSMELPVKEVYVDRQFFGEEENDFANSIMTSGQRKFDTYVAQGVLLNNYANIFGLIMQMRQVADHPDLILKKNAESGQNVLVCCICDEPAEDTVRSRCKHDFCRACVASYIRSTDVPDCPRCHIPLSIDLEQPEIEQDETLVKKNSIINRIKMENWTSSSKIELLVHELHRLRSDNASHKSIIFSQFTTMLQLIEWRLRRAGITTVMLDGSMTPAQRQASIEHFMNNVDVECFLVSLKAGGVALNLTEASRVFIVDPWWNPAAEWQSADRCHRIGQTRPCTITRLCIEDSVESRMVLIQEKKTSMIHSTVNADDKAMESLTPQDMQFLFRGS